MVSFDNTEHDQIVDQIGLSFVCIRNIRAPCYMLNKVPQLAILETVIHW